MQRVEILRAIGWIIAIALMLLFGYFLIIELPQVYSNPADTDPEILGARGEYLGYVVGVPVAIGGALAAVLIALSTDQVARHQMMLAASAYRDNKMDEIRVYIRSFAEQLQSVRRLGAQLSTRLNDLRVDAASTTALIEVAREDDKVNEVYQELMDAFDGLSRAILALASNEVVHACVDEQRLETSNRMRTTVQEFWGEQNAFDLNRDILDIRDRIDFLYQDRTVEDAAAAMILMPPSHHSLDFLGAFIKVADQNDQLATDLLKKQALKEGDELLNYGLVLLASLYQLLPSDRNISRTIGRLYGIKNKGREITSAFKAREVYFSRTTVDVANEAIDGKRLFLKVNSNNVVQSGAMGFINQDNKSPRKLSVSRMASRMIGRSG